MTRPTTAFRLGGETFTCRRRVRQREMTRLVAGFSSGGEAAADHVRPFIAALIVEGDRERFHALLRRRENPVTLDDLKAVVEWLLNRHRVAA